MPRKHRTPFGGAAKKKQLQEKRARKRAQAKAEMQVQRQRLQEREAAIAAAAAAAEDDGDGSSGSDGDDTATATATHSTTARPPPPPAATVPPTAVTLDRHGRVNVFTTVFAREDNAAVAARRATSVQPISRPDGFYIPRSAVADCLANDTGFGAPPARRKKKGRRRHDTSVEEEDGSADTEGGGLVAAGVWPVAHEWFRDADGLLNHPRGNTIALATGAVTGLEHDSNADDDAESEADTALSHGGAAAVGASSTATPATTTVTATTTETATDTATDTAAATDASAAAATDTVIPTATTTATTTPTDTDTAATTTTTATAPPPPPPSPTPTTAGGGGAGGGAGAGAGAAAATPTHAPHSTLQASEEASFKAWLSNIYSAFPRDAVNHFEHNFEVWRQLWHAVVEANCVALLADVRNPLYHVHPSLYEHVRALNKPLIIVLTKTDLVPPSHVKTWQAYLARHFPKAPTIPFSSSGIHDLHNIRGLGQRRKLLREAARQVRGPEFEARAAHRWGGIEALLTTAGASPAQVTAVRAAMEAAAADVHATKPKHSRRAKHKTKQKKSKRGGKRGRRRGDDSDSDDNDNGGHVTKPGVLDDSSFPVLRIALVGSPNVGKSSLINALVGSKRVSVSRTAGHTKWAQTIPVLPKSLHLLDTPGLVFPALLQPPTLPATVTTEQLQMVRDEERAIQECCGVLPLAQVREPYSAVRFLAQHLPLEVMYGLRLPKGESAWSPLVLCEALAEKRGYHLARTGRPDAHRAGREMLADCVDGVSQLRFTPPA